MSHLVKIKTQVRDRAAVVATCERLRLPAPTQGTATLFNSSVTGLIVSLPGWSYPAVCDLSSGEVHYDNFQGHWGEVRELHRFLQAYLIERAKLEARRQGHVTTERQLADGSIRLSIQVGGAV